MNTQKQSLARVWIPGGGYTSNTYYNDRFDLKNGDIVYVEDWQNGKLLRGIVISLIKTFKIRLSDYKKVIAQADRSVQGQLYLGGQYLLGFGKETLPYEKVITWVKPPCGEDEYVAVRDEDGTSFPLDDLEKLDVPDKIRKRGEDYFDDRRVKYLEVDQERVRAIVEGTEFYEVEFTLEAGQIRSLMCDCPYPEICKHEYAAILYLKDVLKICSQWYPEQMTARNYFVAVDRLWFEEVVLDAERKGSVVLKVD